MSEKAVNYIQGYDDGYEDACRKFKREETTREILRNNYGFKDEPDILSRCRACGATFDIYHATDFDIQYCPNCGRHFFDWIIAK